MRHTARLASLRTLALAPAFALGLCTLATFAGCAGVGHGEYTKQHISAANIKMQAMKSATEFEMAKQAFLAGDLDKALRTVDRSIAMTPEVPKCRTLRARVLMEMGDMEGASRSLKDAEELCNKPEDKTGLLAPVDNQQKVDVQYYSGILAERLQRREEALARYEAAAKLDPSNSQYVVAAAEIMIDLDRMPQAEQFLNEAQANFPSSAGVRQTLGHIAMMKNDVKRAAELFNEARLLAPDDNGILEDLVRAQMALGQWAEAEYTLAKMLNLEANKGRRDLLHMRAECLTRIDRVLEAREVYIKLTADQAGAADVRAWTELGNVSLKLKDLNRLRVCASRVIAIAPEQADGYVLKALWQRRQGDLQGAAASLQQALQFKSDADTLVMLGVVYRDLNRVDDARKAFGAALNADAKNELASRALSELEHNAAMATVPTQE